MRKLFNSCLGFIKPKRGEVLLILISMLLFAAVIIPELISMSLPYGQTRERDWWSFSLLLMLGVSIGAGLGTFSWNDMRRDRWFSISVILVLFFCGYLLYRENHLFRATNYRESLNRVLTPTPTSWALQGWLLCLFGTFGAWAITKSVFVVVESVRRRFNLEALTRQRLMIGIAVVLFLFLTARNIMGKSDVQLGEFNWRFHPVFQFLIGVGVVLVGAALPAWGISKIRDGWALLISIVYLGSIAGL